MAPTVSHFVRANEPRMIAAIQNLGAMNPALVVDLPLAAHADFCPITSNMFTGMDLHRELAATVRGRKGIREYRSVTERLLSWLNEAGAYEIISEYSLNHPDVRGKCDLLVRGGYNETGIVEVKACNEVPDYAFSKHRMQLSLYLYAVETRDRGEGRCWGAIAYCSLRTGPHQIVCMARWDAEPEGDVPSA